MLTNTPSAFQPNIKTFREVGFSISENSNGTIFFCLPKGWEKVPDTDGIWGNILDCQGRIRGFYRYYGDTITNITLVPRYTIEAAHILQNTHFSPIRIYVADSGKFSFNVGKCNFDDIKKMDELKALATAHLDGKYPGWVDPTKYWD